MRTVGFNMKHGADAWFNMQQRYPTRLEKISSTIRFSIKKRNGTIFEVR
jgi:hypothetical protein